MHNCDSSVNTYSISTYIYINFVCVHPAYMFQIFTFSSSDQLQNHVNLIIIQKIAYLQ